MSHSASACCAHAKIIIAHAIASSVPATSPVSAGYSAPTTVMAKRRGADAANPTKIANMACIAAIGQPMPTARATLPCWPGNAFMGNTWPSRETGLLQHGSGTRRPGELDVDGGS